MAGNRKVYIFLAAFLIIGAFWYGTFMSIPKKMSVSIEQQALYRSVLINGTAIKAEVVDTPLQMARGLGGRKGLSEDEGMLFVFVEEGLPGIWMKDMQFPIDIIWISKDKIVSGIVRGAKPDSYPETFFPERNSSFVLETSAGFVEKHAIKIGDLAENLPEVPQKP